MTRLSAFALYARWRGAPGRAGAALCLLIAFVASAVPARAQNTDDNGLAPMIARVSPAVVNISVSGTRQMPAFVMRRQPREEGERQNDFRQVGSGVIIDAAAGHIVTNFHVIENAERINVTLFDNRSTHASVVGGDPASDIAILEITLDALSQIEFGDPGALRVGDPVIAIGNPFGFSHSVTSGIVSGLGRSGVVPDDGQYEDFIQTDASINSGNSGGALVNRSGRLVGINSAIISQTGGNIGIGFAISVDLVRNVAEQILQHGAVSRGYLGVSTRTVNGDVAGVYGLPHTAGALVSFVDEASAASAGGLQIGDFITGIDERPVASPSTLRYLVGARRPGQSIGIDFIRDGRAQTIAVELGENSGATSPGRTIEPEPTPSLLDGVETESGNALDGTRGLRVLSIDRDSVAWDDLQVEDVITHVNRERVRDLKDIRSLTADSPAIVLQVIRGNSERLITIP